MSPFFPRACKREIGPEPNLVLLLLRVCWRCWWSSLALAPSLYMQVPPVPRCVHDAGGQLPQGLERAGERPVQGGHRRQLPVRLRFPGTRRSIKCSQPLLSSCCTRPLLRCRNSCVLYGIVCTVAAFGLSPTSSSLFLCPWTLLSTSAVCAMLSWVLEILLEVEREPKLIQDYRCFRSCDS